MNNGAAVFESAGAAVISESACTLPQEDALAVPRGIKQSKQPK